MNQLKRDIVEIQQIIKRLAHCKEFFEQPESRLFNLPQKIMPLGDYIQKCIKQFEMQRTHSGQRFTIMLLGEYNAGKSTLLNALLELPPERRLPVGDRPVNAVPIRLSLFHDGEPDIRWRFSDGSTKNKSWKDGISAAIEGETTRVEGVVEIVAFIDNPLLTHADILDMPGTGTALHRNHTETTLDYISNSELILWVIGRDEPSKEGVRDIDITLEKNVPIVVVFNAWGTLNPDRAAKISQDQESIELSVLKSFPDLFANHDGFTIFSQKEIDRLDGMGDPCADYGSSALRAYLYQEYFGPFVQHMESRRENVIRQVHSLALDTKEKLVQYREYWLDECDRRTDISRATINKIDKQRWTENQLRPSLRKIAAATAEEILDYVESQGVAFIESNLTITKLEIWRAIFDKEGRSKLENDLLEEFRTKYLHLNDEKNIFTESVRKFLGESSILISDHWQRYIQRINADAELKAQHIDIPPLHLETLLDTAMSGVRNFLGKLFATGAVLTILLFIPGGEIVDAISVSAALLISLFRDPFEASKRIAIRKLFNECKSQRIGLENDLVDYVWKELHENIRTKFEEGIRQENAETAMFTLRLGEEIQELTDVIGYLGNNNPSDTSIDQEYLNGN